MKVYSLLVVVALVGCTKRNPAVCCLDAADCDEAGLGEIRDCAAGLACVDHECVVPSCSMTGCQAATPVCNIITDVCEGCTESTNCSKFSDTDVCDTASGACVECVAAADCSASKPVCDNNACRECKLDSECPSGACGDDGACVAESSIVYLDPAGTNAGDCSRSAPCRTLVFASTRTTALRRDIVLNFGSYVESQAIIEPQLTSADAIRIHGGGASFSMPEADDGPALVVRMSVTIRELEIYTDSSLGLGAPGAHVLVERVKVHGKLGGIATEGTAVLRDVLVEGAAYGIVPYGSLSMDRVVVSGGGYGIQTGNFNVTVDIKNTLIYGTSNRAIDLPGAMGTISFSTIVDSGATVTDGPRAVLCSTSMTVRGTIVWAPGSSPRVPIEGCNLISTIAGPTPAPGAMNFDPLFVDSANRDYHIAAGSPARDALDAGPATDIDRELRPRGARFDIGADEAP